MDYQEIITVTALSITILVPTIVVIVRILQKTFSTDKDVR